MVRPGDNGEFIYTPDYHTARDCDTPYGRGRTGWVWRCNCGRVWVATPDISVDDRFFTWRLMDRLTRKQRRWLRERGFPTTVDELDRALARQVLDREVPPVFPDTGRG